MKKLALQIFLSILFLFPKANLSAGDLKIVTINVWSGLDYQGTLKMGEYESKDIRGKRFELLVSALQELNPDIIALNEANPLPRYVRKLANRLGYDQIHVIGNAGIKFGCLGIPTNLKEGDAILAKKELRLRKLGGRRLSGDRFGLWTDWLTFHFQESNNLLCGEIIFEGNRICVAVTHLYAAMPNDEQKLFYVMQKVNAGELSPEESRSIIERLEQGGKRRMDELTKAMEYIGEAVPMEMPVILLGDLNAEPASPELVMLTTWREYIDTYSTVNPSDLGYTWDPENNSNIRDLQLTRFESEKADVFEQLQHINDSTKRRIDYILLSPHFSREQISESRVIFDTPIDDLFISDHYGVYTKIRIGN